MKNWILAIRPKTLFAGLSPVLIGLKISSERDYLLAFLTITCALLLQISSNLINDYYDGIKKRDGKKRLGPVRVVAKGLLPANQVKRAFLLTLSLAFIFGLFLMIKAGWPIILIGLFSLFFAWAYTGGPYPLSEYALGEVSAFLFFGPIAVWGTFFIQTQEMSLYPFFVGCYPGFLIAAIMAINNLRDIEEDGRSKKMTVAVLIGEKKARPLVFLLMIAGMSAAIRINYQPSNFFILFSLLPWIKHIPLVLKAPLSEELNETLAATGKVLFLSSLIFMGIY